MMREFFSKPFFQTGILSILVLLLLSSGLPAEIVKEKPAECVDEEDDALTPLHRAVIAGDLEKINKLLDQGADINAEPTYLKCHRMHKTPEQGYFVHQRKLLSPLYYGIDSRNEAVVSLLLARGAKFTGIGWRPIHSAVRTDQEKMVSLLLKAGADINASDQEGRTPLSCAVENNNDKMIVFLLKNGANLNWRFSSGWTLLHAAVRQGKREAAAVLLKAGISPNAVNKAGDTPLHLIQSDKALSLVKLLSSKGANINMRNKKGLTPLLKASEWSRGELLHLLLDLGADPKIKDFKDQTAFHHACSGISGANGGPHLESLELLLGQGLDINARDENGQTPLFYTIQKKPERSCLMNRPWNSYCFNCHKAAAWMIDHGAKINLIDNEGFSPLHRAIMKNSHVFSVLIEKGANTTLKDKQGNTPLHLAVFYYRKDFVSRLLRQGVKVDAKNNAGQPPLHVILQRPINFDPPVMSQCPGPEVFLNEKIIKLLLAAGTDPNKKDGLGRSPLALAQEQNIPKIIELLKKNGAKD